MLPLNGGVATRQTLNPTQGLLARPGQAESRQPQVGLFTGISTNSQAHPLSLPEMAGMLHQMVRMLMPAGSAAARFERPSAPPDKANKRSSAGPMDRLKNLFASVLGSEREPIQATGSDESEQAT